MSAITAITAQNTTGVRAIQAVEPSVLKAQLDAVFEDFTIDALKTGMLNNAETVQVVVEAIDRYQPKWVVVDPVMVATSGSVLLQEEAISRVINELLPRADLITPNLPEAARIVGEAVNKGNGADITRKMLTDHRLKAVLLKGGHQEGDEISDLFLSAELTTPHFFPKKKTKTANTHGTGCTLSSAITAGLALGLSMTEAIEQAEYYIDRAIVEGADVMAGHGHGPVNHQFSPRPLQKIEI